MNNFLHILLFALSIMIISCSSPSEQNPATEPVQEEKDSMHEEHKKLSDNFKHTDIIILDTAYTVHDNISDAFEKVVEQYLNMHTAFFEEDIDEIKRTANFMIDEVRNVPKNTLEGKTLMAWEQHSDLYIAKLIELEHVEGIEKKRSYFSHISEIMYCTIKSFDFDIPTLYVVYCPMAFHGKGAYWITDQKELQNPYFGREMAKCGEIKEELK